jgi:hypothetical protein
VSKGTGSWSVAVVALILAVAVVAIINRLLGIDDGLTILAVLLIPLLVYGVASGTIREITAPGGWDVRLAETASKEIGASELFDKSIEPLTLKGEYKKGIFQSARSLENEIIAKRWLESGGPPILMLLLKRVDYDEFAVVSVIESLSRLPNFGFVVVTDEDNRVVAYARPQALLQRSGGSSDLGEKSLNSPPGALRMDMLSSDVSKLSELIDAIKNGDRATVERYPGMIKETVHVDSTSADALETMDSLNQDALVVVDEDNVYKGVIKRDRIISHLMVELVKASRPR